VESNKNQLYQQFFGSVSNALSLALNYSMRKVFGLCQLLTLRLGFVVILRNTKNCMPENWAYKKVGSDCGAVVTVKRCEQRSIRGRARCSACRAAQRGN